MAIDVLCVGNMVVDERFQSVAGEDAARPPLRIVAEPARFVPGGMTIVARAMKALGLRAGVCGCVGNDIPGWGLRALLETEGIHTQGLIPSEAPTGFSRIALSENQRWIEHCIGANAELSFGPAMTAALYKSRARMCAIGYAGVLPALDAEGGEGMCALIQSARQRGMLTALDVHTMENESYPFLERPLQEVDIFLCNVEESLGLTRASEENALAMLWERLARRETDRPRLIGITAAEAPLVRYGTKHEYQTERVANPWFGTFTPRDLTGAGDCFRAGLYWEVLCQDRAFQRNELDVRRAVLMGCCAAARALRASTPCAIGPPGEIREELEAATGGGI